MIKLADWEQGGTWRTLSGHRIFCRDGGAANAPVLVLLHGFPTASWDFLYGQPCNDTSRHATRITV